MKMNLKHDLPDGEWLISCGLLYRLKDGVNCDEINVTMAGGSRTDLNRECVATYLLKVIGEAHAKDAEIATLKACLLQREESLIVAKRELDASYAAASDVREWALADAAELMASKEDGIWANTCAAAIRALP